MITDEKMIQNAGENSSKKSKQIWGVLGVAMISQVLFWGFGSPAAFLSESQNGVFFACQSVLISFATLFAIPWLAIVFLGLELPDSAGIEIGKWRFGILILGVALPFVAIGMFPGCNDAEIKDAYPWPGHWLAESWLNMAVWFFIYLFYYIAFEFFYRGFLLNALRPHIGLVAAILIQAIMSVLVHVGKPTAELIASIPAAFLFAWIALATRSIVYAIGLHWAIGILNDLYAMLHKDWI